MEEAREIVECDEECGAYADPNPDDIDELRAAYEHWRGHGWLNGCAHAR